MAVLTNFPNRASTGSNHSPSSLRALAFLSFPQFLLGRIGLLAGILALDCVLLASVPHTAALLGPLAPFGIVSFAVFVGLGYSRLKSPRDPLEFNTVFFVAHLASVAAVFLGILAAWHRFDFLQGSHAFHLASRLVLLAGIVLLALACIPFKTWVRTFRSTRRLWLYSSLAGGLAWLMRYPLQSFWDASSSALGRILQVVAFHSVKFVLRFFLPNVLVDANSFRIGTPNFTVIIAEACSGMEGLGLVLVFTLVWLWYFRRESRFPQALLLVPCALLCVWMLNILRIAALVLIGNAGGRDVAMVGFHSQAGWIAFTLVALAFSMATRKLRWVRRLPSYSVATVASQSPLPLESTASEIGESPATAAYLVPFLAILGASFVSKAASGYFEWLYPLRFIAAVIALWHYRDEYRKLNWRFGWAAPLTGAATFLVWIIPSFWSQSSSTSALGSTLTALSPLARFTWIAFRVLAAVVTVPMAEELAFRGYLARRVMGREFETMSFASLTAVSIAVSSIVFGLMHGHQWMVGIAAGVAFALVLRWRGRIGDAFIAHATSNLLLAAWVLLRGDWGQW